LQCQERSDHSLRDLYGIRGLGASQMDTVIPSEWMKCPAIKLDGTVPGMEAVRVCRSLVLHITSSLADPSGSSNT